MSAANVRRLVLLVCLAAAMGAAGCARVQAWQREGLSQRKMQQPPRPVDAFLDEHIYFSKEASRGGQGGGGGGCGCN